MPVATREAAPAPTRSVRMTLLSDEVMSEFKPFRFKAGTVILVDEETARRWRENGIAVDSAETDKTAAELKRVEIERLQKQLADLESGEAVGDIGVVPEAVVSRSRRAARQ